MTKADEILAANLNLFGTPEGAETPEVTAALKRCHQRAEHSHPVRWVWHLLSGWSRRHPTR
jgi:hypothetical protein